MGIAAVDQGNAAGTRQNEPELWASLVRILATALIFVFHFQGMQKLPTCRLDLYALVLFCFISGWFSYHARQGAAIWLKRRVLKIMVPYWIVMAAVILINTHVGYKVVPWHKILLGFAGLSMFVKDPLYVISWFITLILILYVHTAGYILLKDRYLKIAYLILGFALYCLFIPTRPAYYLSYWGAYLLHEWRTASPRVQSGRWLAARKLNGWLFNLQNYSYPFFLVHGGMLLFVIRVLKVRGLEAFGFALLLTCIGAYYLAQLTDVVSALRIRRSLP